MHRVYTQGIQWFALLRTKPLTGLLGIVKVDGHATEERMRRAAVVVMQAGCVATAAVSEAVVVAADAVAADAVAANAVAADAVAADATMSHFALAGQGPLSTL